MKQKLAGKGQLQVMRQKRKTKLEVNNGLYPSFVALFTVFEVLIK